MVWRKGFEDLEATWTWLCNTGDCTGRVGVIGFCMGGGYALMLASTGGYRASSVNYGMVDNADSILATRLSDRRQLRGQRSISTLGPRCTQARPDGPRGGSTGIPASAFDLELGIPVRDASQIPDIAVDHAGGALYLTWQQQNSQELVEVVVSRSTDGGFTWSAPIRVSQEGETVQSFLPAVSVNDNGTVGVLYYDFRNDVPGNTELSTDVHLALFDAELTPQGERTLTSESFDMRQMVITGSRGYFPGDYVGLDTAGDDFAAAFTVANDLGLPVEFPQPPGLFVDGNNRQDIVFARETP